MTPTDQTDAARPARGVEVVRTGDRSTLRIAGRVDRDTVAGVSGALRDLLEDGVRDVVVDIVDAYDGARLLSVLARTRIELAAGGGSLRLVGVAVPEFLAALVAAPLDEVFLVYDAVRHDPTRRLRRRGPLRTTST